MRMFNVDNSNKYLLKIKEIHEIEEAGDDFTTEYELREMLGLDQDHHLYFRSETPNEALLEQELLAWKNKIPHGRKSIVCTDVLLIEALKEMSVMGYAPSKWVPGLRRLDNKFVMHEKPVRKSNKNDYARLLGVMTWSFNHDKKFSLELKYSINDRAGSLATLKKLITWEEIKWEGLHATEEDKAMMRQIWDNPTMFDKEDSDGE